MRDDLKHRYQGLESAVKTRLTRINNTIREERKQKILDKDRITTLKDARKSVDKQLSKIRTSIERDEYRDERYDTIREEYVSFRTDI